MNNKKLNNALLYIYLITNGMAAGQMFCFGHAVWTRGLGNTTNDEKINALLALFMFIYTIDHGIKLRNQMKNDQNNRGNCR